MQQNQFEKVDNNWIAVFMFPTVACYLLFALWPVLASIYYSFFKWNGVSEWPQLFVGFKNYAECLHDKYFWNAFKNTVIYVILQNAIKLPFTLLLAYALNNLIKRGSVVFRTIIFLPVISSTAIIGIVMRFMLHPWNGPFNQILKALRVTTKSIDFLGQSSTALMVIILVSVWQMAGQYVVYWMAGLQSIPDELYEAAEIDGAGEFSKFFYVTIPMLKPIAIVIAILGVVWSFRIFDLVQVMTGGGPSFSTEVVATFIFTRAFRLAPLRLGYASSVAVLFGVIMMTIGAMQGKLLTKYRGTQGGNNR
ncbi:MAG: sugar ABC transporter permease [bacterium]|nr:sugar ABC transporter permease [bacterium]